MNTLPTVNTDPSKIVKIGIAFELTKNNIQIPVINHTQMKVEIIIVLEY